MGQAYAGSYVSEASKLCKAETTAKYSRDGEPLRIKFKAATGSQVSPRVLLQVLPKNEPSFKVYCDVDGRAWEVVSVERKDKRDDLQVVGAGSPTVAP